MSIVASAIADAVSFATDFREPGAWGFWLFAVLAAFPRRAARVACDGGLDGRTEKVISGTRLGTGSGAKYIGADRV